MQSIVVYHHEHATIVALALPPHSSTHDDTMRLSRRYGGTIYNGSSENCYREFPKLNRTRLALLSDAFPPHFSAKYNYGELPLGDASSCLLYPAKR